MISVSVILCAIAGLFGVYTLIKWFCILRPDIYTSSGNALPIIIGSIAWLSAAVTFYHTQTYNSPIDLERSAMVGVWVWLIYRIKFYRDHACSAQRGLAMYKPSMTVDTKSGDSFNIVCSYTDDHGSPISLADTQIIAWVRSVYDTKVAEFNITILSDNEFMLTLPDDGILAEGSYFTDVRLVIGDTRVTGDVIQINVKKVVTSG